MSKRLVISLGGNAFAAAGESMSMAGQFDFAEQTLAPVRELLQGQHQLLFTHGNGPQVGYILTRVEEAIGKAYKLPLEVCVAESEGEIGYVLQQTIRNLNSGAKPVATLLTQVRVSRSDPAFQSPAKPVGPWFNQEQSAAMDRAGMALVRDSHHRGRRLVASPEPLGIVEVDIIRQMLDMGIIVIAAGGGGIPVVEENGRLCGVEAVVDKDLATALLAIELDAEQLVFVTGVPGVYRDFETSSAQLLQRATPQELQILATEGQFPPGTMGPKVEAALKFVQATGRSVVICQPSDLAEAVNGCRGTRIEAVI